MEMHQLCFCEPIIIEITLHDSLSKRTLFKVLIFYRLPFELSILFVAENHSLCSCDVKNQLNFDDTVALLLQVLKKLRLTSSIVEGF